MPSHDELFAVRQVPSRLRGISARLISDLYDITLNYGRDMKGADDRRFLAAPTDPPVHITIRHASEPRHMFVSTKRHHVEANVDNMVVFGPEHATSLLVVDSSLSLADLHTLVRDVDEKYKDFRDPVTGARLRIRTETQEVPKLSVDEIFARYPDGVAFPEGHTVEMVAAHLDKPDDVAFANDANSPCGFRMVQKSKVMLKSEMERHITEVLAEFGIESMAEYDGLPEPEKQRFQAELMTRIHGPDYAKKKE